MPENALQTVFPYFSMELNKNLKNSSDKSYLIIFPLLPDEDVNKPLTQFLTILPWATNKHLNWL